MPPIVVVSDASVALKWFHDAGEEEVDASRALVDAYLGERILLFVLDLTRYEIGNALLRGHAGASPESAARVLEALREVCPSVSLDGDQLRLAAELAADHSLTFYDAAYAAVAQSRNALLATLDQKLLSAGLGLRPSAVLGRIVT
ncbi:MAG TPA: type II toxin-antitoxin system VapC family toxin [Candidatus Limnocylindrales bacterium]